MENENNLAKNLKAYLELTKMSYAELARAAGLSKTTVCNLVHGKGYRWDTVEQISRAAGIPVLDLMSDHFDPSCYVSQREEMGRAKAPPQEDSVPPEGIIETLLKQLGEHERAARSLTAQLMTAWNNQSKGKKEV